MDKWLTAENLTVLLLKKTNKINLLSWKIQLGKSHIAHMI